MRGEEEKSLMLNDDVSEDFHICDKGRGLKREGKSKLRGYQPKQQSLEAEPI